MIYLFFLIGLILLLKGADYLVEGSANFAKKLRIPALIIGLTIVAFGTSLPELVVNVIAAIRKEENIAFGNIIGSNISNVLLILGLAATLVGIKIKHKITWREIPFTLLSTLIVLLLVNIPLANSISQNVLSRLDGLILIILFTAYLVYIFFLAKNKNVSLSENESKTKKRNIFDISALIIVGLVALFLGGKLTVDAAVQIARNWGMSEYFISLTIIAIGTSLPELFTSVIAAVKKETDLAIGNIVGSITFNNLWVLGLTAIITPLALPNFANVDLLVLTTVISLLFLCMFVGKKHSLERWQGIMFLLLYTCYIGFLITRGG